MHREEDRPRDQFGNLLRQDCCDTLIESNARLASACEPFCPYERASRFTQGIWGIFSMAVESHTDPKNKNKKTYGLDIVRLQFALMAHRVPRSQWLDAWHWMALIIHDLNGKAA